MAQTLNNLLIYLYLIDCYNVKLFVEIGVFQGGLANVIMHRCNLPTWRDICYLGVELDEGIVSGKTKELVSRMAANHGNAHIYYGDAFKEPTISHVSDRIQSATGRVLVLCDGGDKPRELTTYLPLVKPGDILIAHDYAEENPEWMGVADQLLANHPCELLEPELVIPPGNLALIRADNE